MMLLSSAFLMLRLGPASGSFPRPLSPEEERKYVDLWLAGDIEARNVLIEHNLRLVAHIIKKYYTQADDADDLISIGTIGLIKGINTYRPEKGVRLATYASRCCENEILMYFRALKKSSGDISLSESIDVDGDGNTLSLMDIISQEDDMAERIGEITVKEFTRCLVIRMHMVNALDVTAFNALENLYDECAKKGIRVIFSHVNEQPMHVMEHAGFVDKVGRENFCRHIQDAIALAAQSTGEQAG